MRSFNIGNKYSMKNFILPLTGLGLLSIAGTIHNLTKKPQLVIPKQDSALNINTNLLVLMSAGNKRLFSDLLWIQTLIESDLDHYKKKDLNSWLYLRFSAIQALDPKFYENYNYGGQFLSIIKDDLEGANELYVKGLRQYPDDYKLNFQAGFLNYFERRDFVTAKKYLEKILDHPKSPDYLRSIIHKLEYSINKDLNAIFELVQVNYNEQKDSDLKKRLRRDLYVIRAEIDLECLNSNLGNCRNLDLDGRQYVKRGGRYETEKPFVRYGIKTRGEN